MAKKLISLQEMNERKKEQAHLKWLKEKRSDAFEGDCFHDLEMNNLYMFWQGEWRLVGAVFP